MRSLISKLIAVILKELRSQMRGGRSFALLGIYLLLLIGFEWSIAKVFLANTQRMGAESYKMGFMLFTMLSLFQLMLISFLTPSFTAGAVSREKEQQTFDLLVVSEISPISVILGKLVSSLGYVFLLIIASIPVMSTVFLFGSVSPGDFLATFLILIVTTIAFGSLGIFFSSLVRKTQIATALTYGTILFLLAATLIGSSLITNYVQQQMWSQPGPRKAEDIMKRKAFRVAKTLLRLSPANAMTSITRMSPEMYYGPGGNPYSLLLIPMPQFQLESIIMEAKMQRGGVNQKKWQEERPDWHYTVAIYLASSAFLLLVSSRLLLPYRRWRIIKIPFLHKRNKSPPETAA